METISITVTGRIGSAARTGTTKNGKAWASFSLAADLPARTPGGEPETRWCTSKSRRSGIPYSARLRQLVVMAGEPISLTPAIAAPRRFSSSRSGPSPPGPSPRSRPHPGWR